MLVYLIRHGQSETNVTKKRTGQNDVKLTESGYDDARRVGQRLNGIRFDRVFSSDLVRASETARTALPGMNVECLKALRERSIGRIAGLTNDEAAELYGKLWDDNYPIGNYAPFGGESLQELTDRANEVLDMLKELEPSCSNVAVFSHGGIIKRMLELAIGELRNDMQIDNGSIFILGLEGGRWRAVELKG